jgi:hypothetical protein
LQQRSWTGKRLHGLKSAMPDDGPPSTDMRSHRNQPGICFCAVGRCWIHSITPGNVSAHFG